MSMSSSLGLVRRNGRDRRERKGIAHGPTSPVSALNIREVSWRRARVRTHKALSAADRSAPNYILLDPAAVLFSHYRHRSHSEAIDKCM